MKKQKERDRDRDEDRDRHTDDSTLSTGERIFQSVSGFCNVFSGNILYSGLRFIHVQIMKSLHYLLSVYL